MCCLPMLAALLTFFVPSVFKVFPYYGIDPVSFIPWGSLDLYPFGIKVKYKFVMKMVCSA